MKKDTYTAEEFKAICKDFIPHLNSLIETARHNGLDGYLSISINPDGFIKVDGRCLNGWELYRYKGGEDYIARYSYDEEFTCKEGE